ncbi:hypothetical protein J3R30DRAFT_3507477 [Lentinula aciculospora]|uniref:Uncharacterized protein n=1 Tax=Lentinula aciculospora TaxID=153920 RepID=A0A9W9A4H1_9AGAR|nr:hypothetical protein J3R30DRAFT_3507477 [Lentinula aciculospora]
MTRYDLKVIPDSLALEQEWSESFNFTINKFPPPQLPMPPATLPGKLSNAEKKKYENTGYEITANIVSEHICGELEEVNAQDIFSTLPARIFVAKGVCVMINRLGSKPLPSKSLALRVQNFFIQVGQGAPEYSPSKLRPAIKQYCEEAHGIFGRWLPSDLSDNPVGTPGSAARRYEKKRFAPYRLYQISTSGDDHTLDIMTPAKQLAKRIVTGDTSAAHSQRTPKKPERRSSRFSAPSYRKFIFDEPLPRLPAKRNQTSLDDTSRIVKRPRICDVNLL